MTKQHFWNVGCLVGIGLLFLLMIDGVGCSGGIVVSENNNSQEQISDGHSSHETTATDNATDAGESVATEKTPQESGGLEGGKEDSPESMAESAETPDVTKETGSELTQPEQEPGPTEQSGDITTDASVLPETASEQASESSPEQGVEQNPSVAIGNPCKQDSDCGGSPYECVSEAAPTPFPFPNLTGKGPPGGYCTQRCFAGGSSTCPTGSACYVPGAAAGTCLKECKTNADCRQTEGYQCTPDPGSSASLCFPPNCKITQPDGVYDVILGASSPRGSCSTSALPPGTKVNVFVKIQGQAITVEFGSKPGSPLPVTWPLTGTYPGLGQPFTVSKPNGCTQNCDGLFKGNFTNACLLWGTLEMQEGTNCWRSYDLQMVLR